MIDYEEMFKLIIGLLTAILAAWAAYKAHLAEDQLKALNGNIKPPQVI